MDQFSDEMRVLRQHVDAQRESQREGQYKVEQFLFRFRSDVEEDFRWVKFLLGVSIAGFFVLYVCVLALLFR